MKIKDTKKLLLVMGLTLAMGTFTGCGTDVATSTDSSETSNVAKETTQSDGTVADGDLQKKYDELQTKYDELEDYVIYLEQQLAVTQAEYAQIKGQMDLFTQSEGGSKVYLVDAYDGAENIEATEETEDAE